MATSCTAARTGLARACSASVRPASTAASRASGSSGRSSTSSIPAYRCRASRTWRAGRGPTAAARRRLATTTGRPTAELGQVRQLTHGAHEPLQTHRVGASDDDRHVGRAEARQRGLVAAGRDRVVRELLVLLEREAGVDDDPVGQRPSALQHRRQRRRPHLGPAVGTQQAGEHPQPGQHDGRQPHQLGAVQAAAVGSATGRGDRGGLIEQGQSLGDAGAVGVGVDEQHLLTGAGELGGQFDGHRGATGCTHRPPHRHDPTRRAWRAARRRRRSGSDGPTRSGSGARVRHRSRIGERGGARSPQAATA